MTSFRHGKQIFDVESSFWALPTIQNMMAFVGELSAAINALTNCIPPQFRGTKSPPTWRFVEILSFEAVGVILDARCGWRSISSDFVRHTVCMPSFTGITIHSTCFASTSSNSLHAESKSNTRLIICQLFAEPSPTESEINPEVSSSTSEIICHSSSTRILD